MKEKELIEAIEQQARLINFNSSLLKDLGVFYRDNLTETQRDVLVGHLFFDKVAYLLERKIILNYSYLFSNSDNDFFRLPKTICMVIQKHKKLNWIEAVPLDIVTDYSQRIDLVIDSDKIKIIRDKAIAHRERNWKTKVPEIDYKFLQELNILCGEINDKVFRNLSDKVSVSTWDNYQLMNFEMIVEKLVAYKDLQEILQRRELWTVMKYGWQQKLYAIVLLIIFRCQNNRS
jgi:hypothetical protein